MKKVRQLIYLFLIVAISSCSDIIEKSISKDTVILISPGNNDTLSSYSQTFYWDAVDGASTYELQLAYPNFNNIKYFIDTTIKTTRFTYTLPYSGAWQWQVRALNGSSQTSYAKNSLTLITASFTEQNVTLNSPASGSFLSSVSAPVFSWQSLPEAVSYIVIIDTLNGKIVDTTQNTEITLTVLTTKQGSFSWQVVGISDSNKISSTINESVSFILLNSPASVTSPSPANKATGVTSPVILQWVDSANNVSNINYYKVYLQQGGVTIAGYPVTIDAPSTSTNSITLSSASTYTWFVVPYDKAGNACKQYPTWTFTSH